MRWLDELATAENSTQLLYGTIGDTIKNTEDGKFEFIEGDNIPSASTFVSGNFGPAACTESVINNIHFKGTEAIRRKYYFNIYKENTVSLDAMYPNVMYTQDQANLRSQYANDINNYVEEALADFIVNGNVDEGWENYVNQLSKMGLGQLLKVYQEALDAFNAN